MNIIWVLCVKLKIDKKSMSISLGTYDKNGGYALFRNQYRWGRVTKMIVFVKITLVFMWFYDSGVPTGVRSREER